MAGFQTVKTVPKSTDTLIEATLGSRLRITARLFETQSFSGLLAKPTVRISSGWTVNCPGRIFTYWISTTSWHTNGEYKNSSRLRGTFLSSYKKVEAGCNPYFYCHLGYNFIYGYMSLFISRNWICIWIKERLDFWDKISKTQIFDSFFFIFI